MPWTFYIAHLWKSNGKKGEKSWGTCFKSIYRKNHIIKRTRQRKHLKPKKQEIVPKKKKIIKKVIYQEASSSDSDDADEVEVVKVKKSNKQPTGPKREEQEIKKPEPSYTNLIYESSLDKMREKLMNERCKYLVTSLMPQYN